MKFRVGKILEKFLSLSCQELTHNYQTAENVIEVLKGVNLQLEPTQVVAILGPSGSGKTTLLHLLGGLQNATSGNICWGDIAINHLNQSQLTRERAKHLGLVFQQHYLLEDLTVIENITITGRIHNKVDMQRGQEVLEQVGLSQRASFLPHKLSGGERQRVAVARALYAKPKVILADEPTGSLDRHSAKNVYNLLVELAREQQAAVLMVTHDEGLVQDVDARYHLQDGKLVS